MVDTYDEDYIDTSDIVDEDDDLFDLGIETDTSVDRSDIGLDGNDLGASESGDLALIFGTDELVQSAIMNMRVIYGELENEPTRGNQIYNRRLKVTDSALKIVEQDCRNAIMYDTRVVGIPSLVATRLGNYSCIIQFSLQRSDGKIVNGSTQINL